MNKDREYFNFITTLEAAILNRVRARVNNRCKKRIRWSNNKSLKSILSMKVIWKSKVDMQILVI
jgi:hypothetical protein